MFDSARSSEKHGEQLVDTVIESYSTHLLQYSIHCEREREMRI